MQQKNKNLHIVKSIEERTDACVKGVMNDPDQDGNGPEEQIRQHRKKAARKTALIAAIIMVVVAAVLVLVNIQTYTTARTLETFSIAGSADSNYEQFADGVLKYSRDGLAFLNRSGEERWNQSYQIKTPFVVVAETSGAVADKGGNDIVVFGEEGVKGEIHTTLPIQKIAVAEQGIVCAILKQENASQILCYDLAGNVLVEHKASPEGIGYPLDVAISPDGEVMQVVYLYTKDGTITSKVAYYNFGAAGEDKTDRQVTYKEYDGTLMAEGFFLSQDVSVAVGDNLLLIYNGKEIPDEKIKIELKKEIKSVFHDDQYIGLILKNEGRSGYELRLYNASGKQVLSKEFKEDYTNVKICGNQVIMHDGNRCSIFTKNGIEKFHGEVENTILEIFPTLGINKYIMMNANGMEYIRVVK